MRYDVRLDMLRYADYMKYIRCQLLRGCALYIILLVQRAEKAVPNLSQQRLLNRWIRAAVRVSIRESPFSLLIL